jgi:small subunit ribosomal protein S3
MGQKVNPKIFRIGQTLTWGSSWFARGKDYVKNLRSDALIRKYLTVKLKEAGLDRIEIDRSRESVKVVVHSSKPGVIIGRGGAGVEEIKNHIQKNIVQDKTKKVVVDIKEIAAPNLSAMVVAQNVAQELERRVPYRRAMKRNIDTTMKAGAKGIKILCSGRLDGVEIARRETLAEGRLPLHTFRASIDYGRIAARTIYGSVGVKVWIYKGEVFNAPSKQSISEK